MNGNRNQFSEDVVFWCFVGMAAIVSVAISAEVVRSLLAAQVC